MFQSSPGWLQKRWTLTARWRISAVLWGEHALVEFEQESGESLDSGFSYRFLTGRNMNGGVAWGSEAPFSHNYQPLPANFSNSHAFHEEKAKEYFLIIGEKLSQSPSSGFFLTSWRSRCAGKHPSISTWSSFNLHLDQVAPVAPELQMVDYRVELLKHKQFKEGKGEFSSVMITINLR